MDGWTSRFRYRGFEGILVMWLDLLPAGIRMRTHVLDLAGRMHYTMSAAMIANMVKAALKRYDVSWNDHTNSRVLGLSCDNAADGVATAHELDIPCFRCLLHTVNLAFKEPDVLVCSCLAFVPVRVM
jgi:hypothetical protein